MALSFWRSSPLASFPVKILTEIWQRYAGFAMRIYEMLHDAAKARLAFCKRSWPTHINIINTRVGSLWHCGDPDRKMDIVTGCMTDVWLMWVIHWDTNGILEHPSPLRGRKVSSCARFWIFLNCGFLCLFCLLILLITDLRAPITGHNPDNIPEHI